MASRTPPNKLQEKASITPAAASVMAVDFSTSASTAAIFDNDDIYEEVFKDEYTKERQQQPVDNVAIQVAADSSVTTTTTTTKTNRFFPFMKFLVLILAVFIISGVVYIASYIVFSMSHRDDSDNNVDDMMGTAYRENLGIREEITARLGGKAQAKKLLESPSSSSPYAKALEWLIHQDPMQLVPENSNLFQRYVLAYLYYATTIKGPWRSCNPALSGEWETCTHVKSDWSFESVLSTRWLSSVHECMFAGVVCNDKMQVTAFHLKGQGMSGSFPVGIFYLPFLEIIDFGMGDLSGPLPKEIISLENLFKIDLAYNRFSGEVPKEWWKQPHLVYLSLDYNMLSGSIPPEIKALETMAELYLESNKFTGNIPTEVGVITSLVGLYLSNNSLVGPIPTELGQLNSLQALWLGGNLLTGRLPQELGNLTNLGDLNMTHNSLLGGDIPDGFYNMKGLFSVDLSACNFTGSISPSIDNLKHLSMFHIDNNFFTGEIPIELVRQGQEGIHDGWLILEVQNNNFLGKMPSEFCELGLFSLIADCTPDPSTGEIEFKCNCCTECCDAKGVCTPHMNTTFDFWDN